MTVINAISTGVLSLPASASTRANYVFCPQDDFWRIKDTTCQHTFNFTALRMMLSDEMVHSCKQVLAWYLKHRSVSHAKNMYNQLKLFLLAVRRGDEPLSSIESHHISSYRGNLPKEKEWLLGALSGFLQKWYELGYPGIAPDGYARLDKMQLEGTRKGWAVLTNDPEKGPYDELELIAIQRAVNSAFAKGIISNREFSLVWLFMATGARPVQIAALKVKDFQIHRDKKGKPVYLVNMPRAKQRFSKMRDLFKMRTLFPDVGIVLESWVNQVVYHYTHEIVGMYESVDDLPMFTHSDTHNVPGFANHCDSQKLTLEMDQIFSLLKVQSHRTGERIIFTPRRFRYTTGTRTAMEGGGSMVIAAALDLSDTQHARVYSKFVPEIVDRLDAALAMELAPLANAFAGRIVADDSQTTHRDDPSRLIRHPRLDPAKGGVGRCGTGCGGCGAMVPVPCYVCDYFQAWADAPHEEVLHDLTEERRRILEETGDQRIAFANDDAIHAVALVVLKCQALKEGSDVSSRTSQA